MMKGNNLPIHRASQDRIVGLGGGVRGRRPAERQAPTDGALASLFKRRASEGESSPIRM